MSEKIQIDPMAALTEARSLNEYYSNRALILANEITKLNGALDAKDGEREAALQGQSEAMQSIVAERDRLLADLHAAHETINELTAAIPKETPKETPIGTTKAKVVKHGK